MKALFVGKKLHTPKRSVGKWGPAEVRRWAANADLPSYADILADKGGEGLLGLTQLDIHEMAHSSSDAAQLLQELNALHSREGTGVNLLVVVPGPEENQKQADTSDPHAAGVTSSACFESLAAHIGELGITGQGLEIAAQGCPLVGPFIGALCDLHMSAVAAKGFRRSWLELDAYLLNILRVCDAEGRRLAAVGDATLRKLLDLLAKAKAFVEPCCNPGWLGLMISEERVDTFVAVHNALLQVLKDEHLDVLPNGSHLSFGSYQEESRPLRRVLKQVGGGSVGGGLLAVQQDQNALRELASALCIDTKILLRELLSTGMRADGAADAMASIVITAPTKFGGKGDGVQTQVELDEKQHPDGTKGASLTPALEEDLLKAYCSFASFGAREHTEEMDGARFAKLCRDGKLLSSAVTASDADLYFAKVKTKGARKITFAQFVDALALIADKRSTTLCEAAQIVVAANGPAVSGTKADYVKFHDDKSTYTGVYKKGGPSCVDPGRQLSDLVDRSTGEARRRKKAAPEVSPLQTAACNSAGGTRRPAPVITTLLPVPSGSAGDSPHGCWGVTSPQSVSSSSAMASQRRSSLAATPESAFVGDKLQGAWDVSTDEELYAAFRAFASFGSGTPKATTQPRGFELDGKGFVKMCRDSDLTDSRLTTTAIDLIFSRVRGKGARKIDYGALERALPLLAEQKGVSAEEVRRCIVLSEGPRRNSSVTPDFVRLHDDKTTFTGVYAKGGPSTVDKRITAATNTDRSAVSKAFC